MWQECYQRGIAAMSEYNHLGEGVPDLTDVPPEEFSALWTSCLFANPTGQIAIRNLRYKVAPGDVMYAKDSTEIVGCGVVTSEYLYDPDIMDGSGAEWEHFVRVKWDNNFRPIKALIGAEIQTLLRLKEGHIAVLESLLQRSGQALKRPNDEIRPIAPPTATDGALGAPSGECITPGT